jgi:hypothetical protein
MEYFIGRGIDCVGIEGSRAAVTESRVGHLIVLGDLNARIDLRRRFNLVWSYEVAEHIHPKFVDAFLDTLAIHGEVVVLSAAHPGQGGAGHFNEQPRAYWITRLVARGFRFDESFSGHLQQLPDQHAENMMVFWRPNA